MNTTFFNDFMNDEKNLTLLQETMWGPNAIRQTEELSSHFTITKDMRILDLGAGTGLSSLYLAKKYGATIFATDLYACPTENHERFSAFGLADKVIPMILDATKPLPFAKGYFDVIFSVGAYNMFGLDEDMLPSLIPYLKEGGHIALSFPGLKHDFAGKVPVEMQPFWAVPEVSKTVRGTLWWEHIFQKAKGLEVILLNDMACHDIAWAEYLERLDPANSGNWGDDKWTLDMMAAEDGKYFNTIGFVAKVQK